MAIAFACPSCGKKYRVDEKMAGKAAKCQGCGKGIRIPTPASAAATPRQAKPAARPAASPAAQPKPKPKVPDGSEFGLEGIDDGGDLFRAAGGPTRGNPLGEQVIDDYGIGHVDVPEPRPAGSMDIPEYVDNPAVQEYQKIQAEAAKAEARAAGGGKPARKSGEGGAGGGNIFVAPGMIALYVVLFCAFVTGIVGIFAPTIGVLLASLLMILASFINMGAGIWGLVKCYGNSKDNIVEFVLYLLIGPYQIYYWIRYWSVMKGVVGMMGVALLGLMVSGGLMVLFMAMADA